ncbi:hypothetical protein LguiA_019681 [Lonicera macranthoides]
MVQSKCQIKRSKESFHKSGDCTITFIKIKKSRRCRNLPFFSESPKYQIIPKDPKNKNNNSQLYFMKIQ